MIKLLPRAVIEREKWGVGAPVSSWLIRQQLWALLVLELWARMCLDGLVAATPPASLDKMVEVRV